MAFALVLAQETDERRDRAAERDDDACRGEVCGAAPRQTRAAERDQDRADEWRE